MASSPSGNSSGSSPHRSSGSEEDLRNVMDQRKRKRMLSNRESARRSRMRKQKHLDDLMAEMAQLKGENNEILTNTNITTQLYLKMEAENSVLRAQMAELSQRLQSLDEIASFLNASSGLFEIEDAQMKIADDDCFLNPWNNSSAYLMNQPLMASADTFMR
ncbi:bZIP transcription factor 11-like [Malania oleifera]|uniref:bZIP transcription factor 11-like n=1 Tax=Malania oleifera TaxID=397392 RepID=UPI0025ADC661|nr:bZIP transcription factor 11-like [Malania oleifera]